jgi:hypothetical protein
MPSKMKHHLGDVAGEMVDFDEAGRICLNEERRGACESCLWWEWDAARGECGNATYHVCPLYREQLFRLGGSGQVSAAG